MFQPREIWMEFLELLSIILGRSIQNDNYQWSGEHRDQTWDHDIEPVD